MEPNSRSRQRSRGPRPIVAVFAKAPEPGRVKMRLTPVLHANEAADLYRALLQDTVHMAESSGAETVIAFTPAEARRSMERLLGRHRRLLPQGPGDLGRRLGYAFERLCDGRRPVIAVGSDCPGVTTERLEAAAAALERADVVLGPALDGGYYLLGLRRARTGIFENVPWSTDRALEATLVRVRELGLEAATLPPERDVDTPEDLFEWYAGARAQNLADQYPRTWTTLHALLPPRRLSALETAVLEGSEG